MSADDRFRGVDWKDVLHRLTLHSRHLFATARAKGYGNAIARACADPDDLARAVIADALQNEKVKYKPSKGASLITFLCRVLEDDFKDLLRKGMRLNRRLATLEAASDRDPELPAEPGVVYELGDDGQGVRSLNFELLLCTQQREAENLRTTLLPPLIAEHRSGPIKRSCSVCHRAQLPTVERNSCDCLRPMPRVGLEIREVKNESR